MKRKLRVLHILPKPDIGGAERLVVNLCKAFDTKRFEIAVCFLFPKSGNFLEQELEENKIPIYYLNKHKGLDLRMISRLWHLFQFFKPDIIHTHTYVLRYVTFPMILCKIPRRFHTVHNIAQEEVGTIGKIVNWLSFRFGKVIPISISKEVAKTMSDVYNINTSIIYNGVPINGLKKSEEYRDVWREEMGINDSNVVLVHIASFCLQKNHRLLIQAFEQAIKKCPNLILLLLGDGELRAHIEKIVKVKGLDRNIKFLGICQDIWKFLTISDIALLPSDFEGVPMAILEYMVAGRPVIATYVGGVPEMVEDNISGLLVPPQDVQALSQAIIKLSENHIMRKKMGENARRKVAECFDITKIAIQYKNIYLKDLKSVL